MLRLAESGKVAYLDEVMSAYRICVPGSWTARSKTFGYQTRLIRTMNRMWKGYDQWSQYRHHKDVMKMRRDNYTGIFMFTLAYFKRKLLRMLNK